MTEARLRLHYLRGAALTLLAILLLAAMGGTWLYHRLADAELAHRIARNHRNEIQAKLVRANQEEAELREKIARYEALVARGVIGPERRLDWIEQLSRVRNELRLAEFSYELSPQHPVERSLLPSGAQAGGLSFMASTVRLNAGLLHEGDLVSLLNDLRERVPAHVSLRSCQLALGDPGTVPAASTTIKANCVMEWITVQSPKP
jgi:hypothetical protein